MAQVYGEALCNVARCGASRCGNYQPRTIITLGSTDISTLVLKSSIKVTDIINEQPSTASFSLRIGSVTPLEGNSLTIYLGTTQNPIFGGRIMSTDLDLPRQAQRYPRMSVNCVDATWDIDTDTPTAFTYGSLSVTSLVKILLDSTEASYSEGTIEPDMPVIPSFTVTAEEPISSQLTRLMRTIGGWWFVSADRVTHAFVTAASFDRTPIAVADTSPFWGLQRHRDVSQMRTNLHLRGGGGTVQALVDLGGRRAVYMDTVAYYPSDVLDGQHLNLVVGNGPNQGIQIRFIDLVSSVNASSQALISDQSIGDTDLKYCTPGTMLRVTADAFSGAAASLVSDRMGLSHIAYSVDDDTLGAEAAEFVSEAQLSTFDDFEDAITYTTRDKWTVSGKVASLSISSPVAMGGTYVVQRVELSHFDEAETKGPQRQVTLGTNKRDLNDLLRRLIQGRGRG